MNIYIPRRGHSNQIQVDLHKPWAFGVIHQDKPASLKPLKLARPRRAEALRRRMRSCFANTDFIQALIGGTAILIIALLLLFGCQECPAVNLKSFTPARCREKSVNTFMVPKPEQAPSLSRHSPALRGDGGFRSIRAWRRAGSPVPIHPISHDRDGRLKTGAADAFGNP